MSDVTQLLEAIDAGDPKSAEDLLPLVYAELRRLAAHRLSGDPAGITLQPTALVHEAWLRLVGGQPRTFDGRKHFFAAAAEAMRRILIDRAREKQSLKRGANSARVNLEDIEVAIQASDDALLALDEALGKFLKVDPQAARLIELRFFVGLTNEEAGEVMGISERSAKRCWTFGRAWLYRELNRPEGA